MKKRIIIFVSVFVAIAGIVLAIVLPLNYKTIKVISFKEDVVFEASGFNVSNNIFADTQNYQWAEATIENIDTFYDKYIKKYTFDDVPSKPYEGFIFKDGACFRYERILYSNSLLFRESLQYYNDKIMLELGETRYCSTDSGIYYVWDMPFEQAVTILSHVDERYYAVKDDIYFLKAYEEVYDDVAREYKYKLINYIPIIKVANMTGWKVMDSDGKPLFDVDNTWFFE